MKDVVAIVLAAGRGTRMKSELPKVMHELLGKPMISHLLDSVRKAGVIDMIVVAGYKSELLKETLRGIRIIIQTKPLGSGDAVNAVFKLLKDYTGDALIVYGDTPLISAATIKNLISRHKASGASATLLTAKLKNPTGYGRIVRRDDRIVKIVEEEEARFYEEVIEEVNVGTYCFKAPDLFKTLSEIKPDNKKKEYFLTDAIGILHRKGKRIESASSKDAKEIIGVNSRIDLAQANTILRDTILEEFMTSGITIQAPESTTIYPDVRIGKDSIIYPYTVIESDVEIGENCRIGPFAHLRSGVSIGDSVEIGNFVELVRTKIGRKTKVKHHTYLGDATVGEDVNIGAGTITANFDGKNKHKTIIGDRASIGVGAIFIAPVKIGSDAVIGAGSVLPKNRDVPKGSTVVGVPARIIKRGR